MDHITNDTSLIGPCDVIPVGAQNPRFPVVGPPPRKLEI